MHGQKNIKTNEHINPFRRGIGMQSGTCCPRSEFLIFMPSNVYLQKQHFTFHIKKKKSVVTV